MASRYFGIIAYCLLAERDISANPCQRTCGVSQSWQGWLIKRRTLSGTRDTGKCSPQCTSSTRSGAIMSSSWLSSSFEVVVNRVFRGWCGYIPPVWRIGQWWTDRNAAQMPGFTQSLCIRNDTQNGRDRPEFYCKKPCSINSEVLGIEGAVAGMCTSCPVRSKQSTTNMVT